MSSITDDELSQAETSVEVFWRPGCPFCARLRKGLEREGVNARWRNIWTDEDAATVVRAANGGDETVPTVRIGDQLLTNPDAAQVVAAMAPIAASSHAVATPQKNTGAVTATLGLVQVARSTHTVIVEGNHYFPIEDVDMGYLSRTRAKSLCPWKGVASYYTVAAEGMESKNAAWTYLHPSPLARRVKGTIAFWGAVQVTVEDGDDRS